MPVSRRDLLLGLGGGVAGLALTPVPWKLLDDLAIRTQHRRALPIPPRGEVSFHPGVCSLCPAGCALRVRCYGPRPVSVVAERRHPISGGGCAVGLTLHHLAYHPLRLVAPAARRGTRLEPVSLTAAVSAMAGAIVAARTSGGSVMVLDRRPGRAVSQAWAELLAALPNGVLATSPGEGDTLASSAGRPLGIDLERTRTLLSFGAPVLDGWGRPGRLRSLRPGLRIVQVDAWRSPSAALADEWLPIPPGGEGPLAMALAHAVAALEPQRASAAVLAALSGCEPARVGARLGLEPARIESLARSLVSARPAVAIGGGDPGGGPLEREAERAIALLNTVLGSVGVEGGLLMRRELPDEPRAAAVPWTRLAEVPAGSVRLAILDSGDDGRALPWPALARTLGADALVVSLSPFDHELARHAGLLVPAPAPLEAYAEALPTADAAVASYGLAAPVLRKPEGATEPVALVELLAQALGARLSASGGAYEERLKRRVAAICGTGRGRWLARETAGYAEAAPADPAAAWQTLVDGGCWIDTALEPQARAAGPTPLPSAAALERWRQGRTAAPGLALVTFAARGTVGATPPSPLLTKLYQETDLRSSAATVAVHPRTATALGLAERRPVRVTSASGSVLAELRSDPLLAEGRLVLAAGPDVAAFHPEATVPAAGALPLVEVAADGSWRATGVRAEGV